MSSIISVSVHPTNGRQAEGLKGQTFSQPLTGCDLLVGSNGAGKTTRGIIALVACLEGLAGVPTDPRRPYVGSLPQYTSVTVTRGDGQAVTRDLSASRGRAVDEVNQRARDIVGVTPTAWNLSDFSTGTDGDRGKVLDAVARAGGAIEAWDRSRAAAHVHDLLVEAAGERDFTGPFNAALAAHPNAPDGATFLKALEVWSNAEQTRTNTAQKEAEAHWVEMGQTAPPAVEGDEAADRQRADALRAEKAKLQSVDTQAAARHDAEGERLSAELERITESGKRLKEETPAVDPMFVRRIEDAKAAAVADADTSAAEAALADAEKALVVAKADAEKVAAEYDRLAEVAGERSAAKSAARSSYDAAAAVVEALTGTFDTDTQCCHCGAPDPLGFGAKLDAAREKAADAEKALADAGEQYEAAASRLSAVNPQPAQAKVAVAQRAVDVALANLDAARRAPEQAKAAAARALAQAEADLDRETKRREQVEARRLSDLAEMRRRWAAANAALVEWRARPRPADETIDIDRIEAIDSELRDIDARQQKRAARKAHVDATRAAGERYEVAKLRWDATRALVAAVRQARDDLASAAYLPIEAAARDLVKDAVGLPVPYFASPGEYGAEINGTRVPYAGLSESEQRITAAALVYALAVVAKNPVRLVLLDGFEVVQADHRAPLLSALAAARAAGKVDNVVLTMATAPGEDISPYCVDGVTIHVIDNNNQAAEVVATTDGDVPF